MTKKLEPRVFVASRSNRVANVTYWVLILLFSILCFMSWRKVMHKRQVPLEQNKEQEAEMRGGVDFKFLKGQIRGIVGKAGELKQFSMHTDQETTSLRLNRDYTSEVIF